MEMIIMLRMLFEISMKGKNLVCHKFILNVLEFKLIELNFQFNDMKKIVFCGFKSIKCFNGRLKFEFG